MRVSSDDRDYIRAYRSRCHIEHVLACGGHDRAVAFVGTSRGGVEHNAYFGPNTQPLQPFNPFVCDRSAPADLPVLRRHDDHHRGVRTPLSASRAAPAGGLIRDTCAVTRHGLAPTRPSADPRLEAVTLAPTQIGRAHV